MHLAYAYLAGDREGPAAQHRHDEGLQHGPREPPKVAGPLHRSGYARQTRPSREGFRRDWRPPVLLSLTCLGVRHLVQLRESKNASGKMASCAIILMTAAAFVTKVFVLQVDMTYARKVVRCRSENVGFRDAESTAIRLAQNDLESGSHIPPASRIVKSITSTVSLCGTTSRMLSPRFPK